MDFSQVVNGIGRAVEAVGVVIIVIGLALASIRFLRTYRDPSSPQAYRVYRQSLARAVLLGLEFLVAADIIHTVSTDLSLRGLAPLAVIVIIRTFLSIELEMEIEGRWPWQSHEEKAAAERSAS